MKLIPLTNGKDAIVDDEDYEYLMQWKWFARKSHNVYYAERNTRVNNKPKTYKLHRVIFNLSDSKILVDHINHDGLDNRRCNLRLCSYSQNKQNVRSKKDSTSKFLGVSQQKGRNNWRASICFNKKRLHIGCYDSEMNAATAYDKKAKELFGEFANLNFKD